MTNTKAPMRQLDAYIPTGSYELIFPYLQRYCVQLTITKSRKTVLGNYQYHSLKKSHRISVNGNLNKYSFLITLLHELAHLIAFEKYGARIQPHGSEWKDTFSYLLREYYNAGIFPDELENALQKSLRNAAASTCGDPLLMRTLKKYDAEKPGVVTVEELSEGSIFCIENKRIFTKGAKLRTRFKCQELSTGKWYLFNGLYEVAKVEK